jgi:hypothetical protein
MKLEYQLMPKSKSEAGKLGYQAVTARLGKEFHQKGGQKSAELYFYTSPLDGAVGYEAAVRDRAHKPKGKPHRHAPHAPLQLHLRGFAKTRW